MGDYYTWFGFEEPFPWLPIAVCAIPILLILFAVVLGLVLMW